MKKIKVLSVTFALCAFSLISCKKQEQKIDPSDANALQSVLVIPGGERRTGNPPPPTGTTSSPKILNGQSTTALTAGGQVAAPFSYNSNAGYNRCIAQVRGATNGYFEIPTNSSTNSGQITIPLNVPANVGSGTFCVQYCIVDAQNRVSNQLEICVNVTEASSGGGGGGGGATGTGTFTLSGQSYSNAICVRSGANIVLTNSTGSASLVFYNAPTASSGSIAFTDGANQVGFHALSVVNATNSPFASRAGGTFTKTASNKFTFSCTMYDISTNQTTSASGSGTY
jgi:hypothetical protein